MTAKKAFKKAQNELKELGIFHGLLDTVELRVTRIPAWVISARGWFYDVGVGTLPSLLGWREGVIYLPYNMEWQRDLLPVIRHEFAHSWAWSNPSFLKRDWFRKTFGRSYFGAKWPKLKLRCFEASKYWLSHASAYATTSPAEDFAETFETYMRWRNTLDRFSGRPAFYRKLRAVETAVKTQRKELHG
jgi:hypothetical protein